MAQLSDDCFAFGGALTPAAEALAQLESVVHPIAETEAVGLKRGERAHPGGDRRLGTRRAAAR